MPKGSECKVLETADVDNPCKKHKIRDEFAPSAVITVDEITIDTVSVSSKVNVDRGRKRDCKAW